MGVGIIHVEVSAGRRSHLVIRIVILTYFNNSSRIKSATELYSVVRDMFTSRSTDLPYLPLCLSPSASASTRFRFSLPPLPPLPPLRGGIVNQGSSPLLRSERRDSSAADAPAGPPTPGSGRGTLPPRCLPKRGEAPAASARPAGADGFGEAAGGREGGGRTPHGIRGSRTGRSRGVVASVNEAARTTAAARGGLRGLSPRTRARACRSGEGGGRCLCAVWRGRRTATRPATADDAFSDGCWGRPQLVSVWMRLRPGRPWGRPASSLAVGDARRGNAGVNETAGG